MHEVRTEWTGGMSFDSTVAGHHVKLDAAEEFGGRNEGPTPKPLLLTALTGCTGMDVVSLLKKMRIEYEGFSMTVKADVAEEHPKVYTSIHLVYEFTGRDLPLDKLKKAVELSQEQYCSVSAMLSKACKMTYELKTA